MNKCFISSNGDRTHNRRVAVIHLCPYATTASKRNTLFNVTTNYVNSYHDVWQRVCNLNITCPILGASEIHTSSPPWHPLIVMTEVIIKMLDSIYELLYCSFILWKCCDKCYLHLFTRLYIVKRNVYKDTFIFNNIYIFILESHCIPQTAR